MKKALILFFCFSSLIFSGYAQSDAFEYLKRSKGNLEQGDCEKAQRNYNVYKELTGKTDPSVEALINECSKALHLGDVIDVGGEKYTVAYLVGNKQHGFAIRDIGVTNLALPHTLKYIRERKIPTLEEMRVIYNNNSYIGLTGQYWTSSVHHSEMYGYSFFYLKDFISGQEYYGSQNLNYGVILIHRF